jgi:hypothetical protein
VLVTLPLVTPIRVDLELDITGEEVVVEVEVVTEIVSDRLLSDGSDESLLVLMTLLLSLIIFTQLFCWFLSFVCLSMSASKSMIRSPIPSSHSL